MICNILRDVPWTYLAVELGLPYGETATIQTICMIELNGDCFVREVVIRFIHSQPLESCWDTMVKIAKSLKHRPRVVSELKDTFQFVGECIIAVTLHIIVIDRGRCGEEQVVKYRFSKLLLSESIEWGNTASCL